MDTTENSIKSKDILRTLRQVSLLFFFLLGTTHIVTGLMASENIFLPASNLINRVLDIPFILVGIVYGLSQAKISSDSHFKKTYLATMVIIALFVLAILLYINLLIPDKIT